MPNTIADAVIELMVKLQGSDKALRDVNQLFQSIRSGADKANKSFISMGNMLKDVGLKEFAKNIKDIKNVKFKVQAEGVKQTTKSLNDLERAAIRAFDKANPDSPFAKEGRAIRAKTNQDISDIKARGQLQEGFAGRLTEDAVKEQSAAIRKQGDLELRNLKERNLSHEQLLALNNAIGNQTESELKAIKRQTKELEKQEEIKLKNLRAQRESRLNRLDPDRKEKQEIEARHKARLAETAAANELNRIEGRSLITATQKRKEIEASQKIKELELRDIKDRRKSQQELVAQRNVKGNRTESEIKARNTLAKQLRQQRAEDLKNQQMIDKKTAARIKRIRKWQRDRRKAAVKLAKEESAAQEKRDRKARKLWRDRAREARKLAKIEAQRQLRRDQKAARLRRGRAKDQRNTLNESADRGFQTAASNRFDQVNNNKRLKKSIEDVRNARKKGIITAEEERKAIKLLNLQLNSNVGLRNRLRATSTSLASFGNRLENIGRSLTFLGRQAVVVGIAVSAAFLPAIISAAQFEQSVVDAVSVIEGNTIENFGVRVKDLSDDFLELGERSEFTATQIASGAKQLGLAGFNTQEIKDSIEAVTNLATVGDIATEDAARIAANITKAFKLDAKQFTDVSDILTSVATNSNTTIQSIAESFKLLAPIASNLGQDLGEVSAAIAVLGDAGVKGSRGGTGLSRFYSELLEKSDKFKEKLEEIDSTFESIDPRKNDISEIIKEFERLQQLGKLDTQDFFELFDERSARVVVTLLNQGSGALDELVSKNKDAANLAQSIKNIKLDTVVGDFKVLKSTIDTLFSAVGQSIIPTVRELIQWLTNIAKSTKEWVLDNQALVAAIIEITVKLGLLITGLGSITLVIGTVAVAAGTLTLAVSLLAAAFAALQIVSTGSLVTLGPLAATILIPFAAIIPVLSVITGAILIVVGVTLKLVSATARYNEEVRKVAAQRSFENMKDSMEEAAEAASKTAAAIRDVNQANNLIGRFDKLKPLEIDKLFGDKAGAGLGNAGIDLSESIKFDESELVKKSAQIEKLKQKIFTLDSKSFARSATFGFSGIFGTESTNEINRSLETAKKDLGELERQFEDIQNRVPDSKNALIDRKAILDVSSEDIDKTFDELARGNEKLNKLQAEKLALERRNSRRNENFEENNKKIKDLERQISLEGKINDIREIRSKLGSTQREAFDKIINAQKQLDQAAKSGASDEALQRLSDNLSNAQGEYRGLIEEQQLFNEKAGELKTIMSDISSLKNIAPKFDASGIVDVIEKTEKLKKSLFELDKAGNIKPGSKGPLIRASEDNVKKTQEKLDNIQGQRDSANRTLAEKVIIGDTKARANQIKRQNEARAKLAELDRQGADGFTKEDRLKQRKVKQQEETDKLKAAADTFVKDSEKVAATTKKGIKLQEDIKKLEFDAKGKNLSESKKLDVEKDIALKKLELEEIEQSQKLAQAVEDAKNTKSTDEDDIIAKRQQKNSKDSFRDRRRRVNEEFGQNKKNLGLKKDEFLLEQKLNKAKAEGNKEEEARLTRELGEKRIERELQEEKKENNLTDDEVEVVRQSKKAQLDKEVENITKEEKKPEEDKRVSREDAILNSLQQQAKTLADKARILRFIDKLERDRVARANKLAGKSLRQDISARRAQERADADPENQKLQDIARREQVKAGIKRAAANAGNAIGAPELKAPKPAQNAAPPQTAANNKKVSIDKIEINLEGVQDAEEFAENLEVALPPALEKALPEFFA